jgi:hypothetical protein
LSCSLLPLITAWSGVQSFALAVRALVVFVVVVVSAGAVEVPVVVSRVVVAGAVELVRTGSSMNLSLSMHMMGQRPCRATLRRRSKKPFALISPNRSLNEGGVAEAPAATTLPIAWEPLRS